MAPIDAEGRVFGRINLVDLLVGLAVVVAVPLGYAAYLLWRAPAAELTEVVPAEVTAGPTAQVEIHGKHFRPYMRLSFGATQGPAFYYVSDTVAVVPLPALAPGKYDLVLYDYSRESSRLREALTVLPTPQPPGVQLDIDGAFVAMPEPFMAQVVIGTAVGPTAAETVRRVGTPVPSVARVQVGSTTAVTVPVSGQRDLPATIRITCRLSVDTMGIQRCLVGDAPVTSGSILTLPPFGGVKFRVEQVRAAEQQ